MISDPERVKYIRVGPWPYLRIRVPPIHCPCKGRITLLAPYRGGGVWVRVVYVGASPYAGLCAPYRGNGDGERWGVNHVGSRPYPRLFDPFRV